MDTGNKTLAQLADEGREARYVSLDVGSKLSGYTKEYLERLCSSRKVNCLLYGPDQYALELESLLKETQTILLSYEGVTFLEKSGLSLPPQPAPFFAAKRSEEELAQNAPIRPLATQIPHFSEHGRLPSRDENAGMFSFTGRAVVSDSRHPASSEVEETHIPIAVLRKEVDPTASSSSPSLKVGPVVSEKSPEVLVKTAVVHAPLHIPITQSREPLAAPKTVDVQVIPAVLPDTQNSSQEKSVSGNWDDYFIGGNTLGKTRNTEASVSTPPSELNTHSSQYHPVQTSVDSTLHHEDLPLFPKLINKDTPAAAPSLPKETEVMQVEPPATLAVSTENTIPAKRVSPLLEPKRPSLPRIRVMPQIMLEQKNLPALPPEHHLMVFESHPLMKSVGFNTAFALLFLLPSFVILSGVLTRGNNISSPGGTNVAAIGAVDDIAADPNGNTRPTPSVKEEKLEFSDEVVAVEGEATDTVLIQPIWRGGAGIVHEYSNAHLESTATSTAQ